MKTVSVSALVTNCSARKSVASQPGLTSADIGRGTQDHVVEQWLKAIARGAASTTAQQMYAGRGADRIRRVAESLRTNLYFVSAGLGLVNGGLRVPAYDLSASAGTPSSVQQRIVGDFSAEDWWSELRRSPFATAMSSLFEADTAGLVLVAVSNSYVSLLSDELSQLAPQCRDRLRLFGAVDAKYPAIIKPFQMPYDSRLDDVISGSKVDFAQRAAEHFVSGIMSSDHFPVGIEDQKLWVQRSLDQVVVRPRQKRQTADDARIRALAAQMAAEGMSHTKALKTLRQEHGIACEQARFRKLFLEVAS